MAIASGTIWARSRALAPLGDKTFRGIWSASLLSNFGQLLLGVAAAWEMTRLTNSPQMIALVQTALMLPIMFVAVPAGALADMFNRRTLALVGLSFAIGAASLLALLAWWGLAGPWVLLGFCFLIGGGVAFYGPSWQASIAEQVSPEHLPAAVALGSVSYNIARSFGPAVGGVIVLALGAKAAFATNALLYVPLATAFFFWKRKHIEPRLPPERLDRAIISGIRYALYASAVRTVMIRTLAYGFAASATAALTPLVAKTLLHGDAGTYGLLLGASGVGAVAGAFLVGSVRDRLGPQRALSYTMLVSGAMTLVVAVSPFLPLTCAALFLSGAAGMQTISMLNVSVQLSVPRWVAARALSWFQSSLTGGIAFGAWMWGSVTERHGVSDALIGAAVTMMLLPLLGRLLPLRRIDHDHLEIRGSDDELQVTLGVTPRSGPIVIEVDYLVDAAEARSFYDAMLKLQRARLRNGAFGWSMSRDIGDAELWTERFQFPTWQEYQRHRGRFTRHDSELQTRVDSFNRLPGGRRVRRRLERPFGSVRWRAETPVPSTEQMGLYTP